MVLGGWDKRLPLILECRWGWTRGASSRGCCLLVWFWFCVLLQLSPYVLRFGLSSAVVAFVVVVVVVSLPVSLPVSMALVLVVGCCLVCRVGALVDCEECYSVSNEQ